MARPKPAPANEPKVEISVGLHGTVRLTPRAARLLGRVETILEAEGLDAAEGEDWLRALAFRRGYVVVQRPAYNFSVRTRRVLVLDHQRLAPREERARKAGEKRRNQQQIDAVLQQRAAQRQRPPLQLRADQAGPGAQVSGADGKLHL
jgi:hypothetical protein